MPVDLISPDLGIESGPSQGCFPLNSVCLNIDLKTGPSEYGFVELFLNELFPLK